MMARLRIGICIGAIIIYCAFFNLYLYELFGNTKWSVFSCKLLLYYLSFGFLLFFLLDWKAGFQNYLHKQLNLWCVLLMLIHYGFIIAAYYGLKDPVITMVIFNISVIVSGSVLAVNYFKTTWKH